MHTNLTRTDTIVRPSFKDEQRGDHNLVSRQRKAKRMAVLLSIMLPFAVTGVAVGSAVPALATSTITVDQFVADTEGHSVSNVQGTYPGECVSLVSQYLSKVYGVATSSWGNAVNYRAGDTGGTQMQNHGFLWQTDRHFQDGDVLVWSHKINGHVGIWYHGQVFDQNWLSKNAQKHDLADIEKSSTFLGYWRPWVQIVSVNSGKVLDATGGSASNGVKVQQYDAHSSDNQQWILVKKTTSQGVDYYAIVSKSNLSQAQVLDATSGNTANGTQILTWSYNGGPNQMWRLISKGSSYEIRPLHAPDKCLDITAASTSNGAKAQLWTCNGTNAQRFRLQLAGTTSQTTAGGTTFAAKAMADPYSYRRTGPGTNYSANGTFPYGSVVNLVCYTYGGTATGHYGTSTLWYQTNQSGLWISDTNVYTGSSKPVTPHC